jgi:hypothetical protein
MIAASVVKDGDPNGDAAEFGRLARKGMEDILDVAARAVGRGESPIRILANLGDALGLLIDTMSGGVAGWQARARVAEAEVARLKAAR